MRIIKSPEFKSQYEGFNDNNLENAPADMEFYNRELGDSIIPSGIKKGNNTIVLRKGPGSNYEAIFDDLVIVEGATTVRIWGENKDWYYIYYHGGAGGGLNYNLGYVEKDKLSAVYPDDNSSSSITGSPAVQWLNNAEEAKKAGETRLIPYKMTLLHLEELPKITERRKNKNISVIERQKAAAKSSEYQNN